MWVYCIVGVGCSMYCTLSQPQRSPQWGHMYACCSYYCIYIVASSWLYDVLYCMQWSRASTHQVPLQNHYWYFAFNQIAYCQPRYPGTSIVHHNRKTQLCRDASLQYKYISLITRTVRAPITVPLLICN